MSRPLTSVFDLSESEKLQLVQDLWDDLASTPEAVPIYPWQQEDLMRRKENLQPNPVTALEWADVKRRVGTQHGG